MKYKLTLALASSILIIVLIFITWNVFKDKESTSVQNNIKNFVSVTGTDEDELWFYRVNSVKYNKYDNNVYVVDSGNYRIVVLDSDLNYITDFGREGQGPSDFKNPKDIAFDKKGNIVVADRGNNRIQILNKDFKYVSGFRIKDIASFSQSGVLTDSQGRIYINAPSNKSLITVFDIEGNEITNFGEIITEIPAATKDPGAITAADNAVKFAIDGDDNIYCAFFNYPVIRKYDNNFKLKFEINYENLSVAKSIKKRYERIEKEKPSSVNNLMITYRPKAYVKNISADDHYLYLKFGMDDVIYVFDKYNGDLLDERVDFKYERGAKYFDCFDFSSNNFIYAFNRKDMCVVKFKK